VRYSKLLVYINVAQRCGGHMFRLIGIPHAGGSAASLAPLKRHLSHALDFRAVELPGRGIRHSEPLHTERIALIQQLCSELVPATEQPYALFGHSLGAILAYELAQALIARGCRAPSMLFAAAAPAPSTWPRRHVGRPMSDAELRDVLAERGGTPPEFFDHPSLVDLFMPVLRADFQLCDGAPAQGLPQLACPVHVSAGLQDDQSVSQLAAWRHVTNREFSLRWFDGDHFFVRSHASQLSTAIIQQLKHADVLPTAMYASIAAS